MPGAHSHLTILLTVTAYFYTLSAFSVKNHSVGFTINIGQREPSFSIGRLFDVTDRTHSKRSHRRASIV